MNWLLVALLAQVMLGTSAVFDKLILKKAIFNPLAYTFWLGILGLVAVFLLPFGAVRVPIEVVGIGLLGGASFIVGMFFYFLTLDKARAGGSIVTIAGFSPVATLVFSSFLLGTDLSLYQEISFALLLLGGFMIAFLEEKEMRLWALWYGLVAAGFLGMSYVLSKIIFDESNFVTGFFWTKLGGAIVAFAILVVPHVRERITRARSSVRTSQMFWYVANRAYAGAGSVLVFYAISLGTPALVNALESMRFFIVFVMGWALLHTRFRLRTLVGEFVAFTIISLAIITLGAGDYAHSTVPNPARSMQWGVTFSEKFSRLFDFGEGKTWQDNYDALLDDLGARHLRLIAYWDLIEPQDGAYDFSGLDYQMRRAEEVGADVILVVGKKVPRWPECHTPEWAAALSQEDRDMRVQKFVSAVVERYTHSPALRYWQVENEPFLAFGEGECALSGSKLLDTEMAIVRSIDSARPILVTDSGELGLWYRAAKRGDVFGTTMYRRVHSDMWGNFEYPLPPAFFRLKETMTRFLIRDYEKKFIVIELGMEPWLKRQPYETTPEEQSKVFDFSFFEDSIGYAKETGFDEYYLWGAEWWYWMRVQHNDPRFWDAARELFG